MGTIRQGANGAFSGKAGSVVGSSWKKVDYIKGLPKIVKRPGTQKQILQRARFALVSAYITPIKSLVKIGFRDHQQKRVTGYNMAIQYAINHALVGEYPNIELDRSKVLVARGGMQKPTSVTLDSPDTAKLKITYSNYANKLTGQDNDNLVVLVYDPILDLFMPFVDLATRQDGELEVDVATESIGHEVEVHLFFTSFNREASSTSVFAGTIAIS